jgi:hypothetical protein
VNERPTPLTDEAIRAAGGQWTFLARDLSRDLERQLAERDAQLAEARTALELIIGKNSMLRSYTAEEAASDAKQTLARIDAKPSSR